MKCRKYKDTVASHWRNNLKRGANWHQVRMNLCRKPPQTLCQPAEEASRLRHHSTEPENEAGSHEKIKRNTSDTTQHDTCNMSRRLFTEIHFCSGQKMLQ